MQVMDRQRAARAVAARRGQLDMTQQELAGAAGVDIKTIGNLESRGRWPIARTRARIEKALGWPVGEMERIASQDAEDEPLMPPGVRDAVRATLPPDRAARVEAAIEAALRGEPPPGTTTTRRAEQAEAG